MLNGAAVALGLSVLLTAAPTVGQQPVFRANTDIVPLYVTVRDSQGRAVTDLSVGDFLVRIDGREQPVASFSNEPQPFSAVLLIDYSSSMSAHRPAVREAAAAFVARLLPHDRVRIGGFSNHIVLEPDAFTGDQPALLASLGGQAGRVDAGGASPVWAAARASLQALETQTLRRVLVLLSDGHDATALGQAMVTYDDVERRVRDLDVLVHALGFVNRRPPRAYNDRTVIVGPDPGLEGLARRSSGLYFEVDRSPDFVRIFTEIIDDLHSQYLIGVPVDARDGRRHQVDVRVRRPRLNVRAPRSFVARR